MATVTYFPPVGATFSGSWRDAALAFAQSLSASLTMEPYPPLTFSGDAFRITVKAAGSGNAFAQTLTQPGGTWQIAKGSAASGQCRTYSINGKSVPLNASNASPNFIYGRVFIPQAPSASTRMCILEAVAASTPDALGTGNDAGTACLALGIRGDVDTTHLCVWLATGGNETHSVGTQTLTLNQYIDYALFWTGSSYQGYVGQFLSGTMTQIGSTISGVVNGSDASIKNGTIPAVSFNDTVAVTFAMDIYQFGTFTAIPT